MNDTNTTDCMNNQQQNTPTKCSAASAHDNEAKQNKLQFNCVFSYRCHIRISDSIAHILLHSVPMTMTMPMATMAMTVIDFL